MTIIFGSLFSGIGGFDLGFERSGMRCAWQCEIDVAARTVLTKQFGKPIIEDVRNVRRDNVAAIDLVCGGFPCQDLSVAGKRAGLAGERSGLWFEFRRVVEELGPKWVVIENVPGLLSSNGGADFAAILRGLVELRYGVAWRILDAQYFGVPQRRRRVFIVASLGNGRAAEVLFERESMPGNPPPRREEGEGDPGTFTIRTGKEGGGKGYLGQVSSAMTLGGQPQWVSPTVGKMGRYNVDEPLAYNIHQNDDGRKDRPNGGLYVNETDTSLTLQTGQAKGQTVVMSTGQANAEIVNDGSPSLTCAHEQPIVVSSIVSNGDSHSGFRDEKGLVAFTQEQEPKFGDIAGTLGTYNGRKAGDASFTGVRRLTPLECERLQGFPDGWTAGQSDSARYRQLGNAVAVPVIEWIGRRLMAVRP